MIYLMDTYRAVPRESSVIREVFAPPLWRRNGLASEAHKMVLESLWLPDATGVFVDVSAGNERDFAL